MGLGGGSDKRRENESGVWTIRGVSRRKFLKMAGLAGAAIGTSAGLGGLLAACGTEETTTTAGATTTTAGATTTTAGATTTTAGATTTVSAAVETGRELKAGFPSPDTGALAAFAEPNGYCADRWREAIGDGLLCGDGKKHPITIIQRDTQSDSNRAAQVTGDLIQNDKVDIVLAASTPDTVCSAADQCETFGVPFLGVDCPQETFWAVRGKDPTKDVFTWTYLFFMNLEDWTNAYMDVWDKVETNKSVALMFPNDADGNGDRLVFPDLLTKAGYTIVDGGAFPDGLEDYTSIIAKFKKEGAEIVFGDMNPPDFMNFWKQAMQQGFRPKMAGMGKALMFAESAEAAGTVAYGMLGEAYWGRHWPFLSSLTGETCEQMCSDYETKTNRQWSQAIGMHYPLGEWMVDVYKRTTSVDDKNAVMQAVKTAHLDTIAGRLYLDEPVKTGTRHRYENAYSEPQCIGQWVKGTGKYPFDFVTVDSTLFPEIAPEAKMIAMTYSS